MAKLVPLPSPVPQMAHSDEFIKEYEVIYYTILKKDRDTKKLTKMVSFESITPTTDVTEQDVPFYSEKSVRTISTAIDKSFGTDGYFTKEELSQEMVAIVDEQKLANKDTEYPLYRVLLYRPLGEGEDSNRRVH